MSSVRVFHPTARAHRDVPESVASEWLAGGWLDADPFAVEEEPTEEGAPAEPAVTDGEAETPNTEPEPGDLVTGPDATEAAKA